MPETNDNNKYKDEAEEKQRVIVKKNQVEEIGGPKGPEPTRYGDWERRGRCIDF